MVIERRLSSVGCDLQRALREMSGRYESIGDEEVIILDSRTAYKPALDVTTHHTIRTNKPHCSFNIRAEIILL